MNRKKMVLLWVSLALLIIAAACSPAADVPAEPTAAPAPPSPVAAATPRPTRTPVPLEAVNDPRGVNSASLCIPSERMGIEEGAAWTITGALIASDNFPGQLPEGVSDIAISYTINSIKTATIGTERGALLASNAHLVLVTLNEIKDRDGAVLQTSTSPFEALAVNVYSTPPALTLDWECHSRAWSRSWSVVTANATPPEPKVEEVTFDWGEEGMLFTVTQSVVIPDQEIEQTSERSFGYELSTGRLVSIRTSTFGKIAGEPFSLLIDQSLASGE